MSKYQFVTANKDTQDVDLDVSIYAEASKHGRSLTEHLQVKYPSLSSQGSTLEQFMVSAGMFLRSDHTAGIRSPSMETIFNGGLSNIDAGSITRNDGSNNNTPSGRMLFPEVIMQVIKSELDTDNTDFLSGYNDMIAQTQNVIGPKFDQPVINVKAPEGSRSQPIGQLAEPAVMVSITLSEVARRIPTKSIGLTIADEAMEATSLDLVGLSMTAQARQERVVMVEGQLKAMVLGDADVGESIIPALQTNKAVAFDSTIAAAGAVSHLAWIKWLRNNYRKRTISHIVCDVDSALAIEGRSGKPTMFGDDPNSPRIDALFTVENLGIRPPKILLVDTSLIAANAVIGIDSRTAIRRVVNVSASYNAIEAYVMRRATSLRVDYGELSHKLMGDAWERLDLIL